MLRDVPATRWRVLMPRKGTALVLGCIVSQFTLAPSHYRPEEAPHLAWRANSDPATSLDDPSHRTTEARLRHFARAWTHKHIKIEHVRRDQRPSFNVGLPPAPSGPPPEQDATATEKSSPAMAMLELDPFNSYARAMTAPETEIQGVSIDD